MDNINFNGASEEVIELASNYAEKFVNYVENLPFDLQRNITRLREIDQSCRDAISEIETLAANFTKDKDNSLKGRTTLLQIQRLFGRCQELGDEKIYIVQQISETVDNRKKQVEHSAYRFKIAYRPDLKDEVNGKRELTKSDHKGTKRTRRRRDIRRGHHADKLERPVSMDRSPSPPMPPISRSHTTSSTSKQTSSSPGGTPVSETPSKIKEETRRDKEERNSSPSPSSTPSSAATQACAATSSKASYTSKTTMSKVTLSSTRTVCVPTTTAPSSGENGSNKSVTKSKKKKRKTQKLPTDRSPSPQDIPIDPDEPTYCLCGQVSFGQMIGCDNKKCPIEWFHFSCVGLTHNPKGKWYCPDCARDMKERKRDGKHR